MKKKVLFISTIVILMVVVSSMLFACSNSSTVLEGKEYENQVKYYESIKADVKKNESLLNSLLSNNFGSTWSAKFVSTRTYYYTSEDNIAFKGDATNGGYDQNGNDKTPWYTQAITYAIQYKNGDVYIVAQIHKTVDADTFTATKLPEVEETKKYLKTSTIEEGDVSLYNATVGIMKGDMSNNELLEKYVSNIDSGFRLVASIMQYQVVRPYAYTVDGKVDTSNIIDYTQNQGKTKYSISDGDVSGDQYTYFDDYKDDINYNFAKIAEVHNERVTLTYKKSKSLLETYEYLEEIVLPYYAIKDDFNNYNVLKCRVADYTHWVMEFDYETPFTMPANL